MYSRFIIKLRNFCTHPRAPWYALVLAVAITLPALFSGFWLDDYIHVLTLEGKGMPTSTFDLFCFGNGDPEVIAPLIDRGTLPWYTLPELKVHFFRPLSSATMALDHSLFGRSAVGYHLHSTLWYLLLIVAIWLLLRRLLPLKTAVLVLILYALDDGHIPPVLWLSNRNAIVSAVPALLGLVAHLAWRERGWKPGLPLSLLGYVAGLLGGETALGIMGYLIAYELLARDDRIIQRVKALVGGGIVSCGYLVYYKVAGYGVYGSGVYVDPVTEFAAFATLAPERLATLVGAQFFAVPPELPVANSALYLPVVGAGFLSVGVLIWALVKLWSNMDKTTRRHVRWMGVGALLATVPSLATFPSGRLLILPSLGAALVTALIIQQGLQWHGEKRSRLLVVLAHLFVVLHLVLMPLFWVGNSLAFPAFTYLSNDAFHTMEIDDDTAGDELIFSLYAPDPYTGFYSLIRRDFFGYPSPKGWQNLSVAPATHRVTRTHENRFEVEIVDGELLSTSFEQLLRSRSFPYAIGDQIERGGYVIEILEIGEWGPTRFSVAFPDALESSQYRFLAWKEGQLRVVTWPPIGTPLILTPEDGYFTWEHLKKRLPF